MAKKKKESQDETIVETLEADMSAGEAFRAFAAEPAKTETVSAPSKAKAPPRDEDPKYTFDRWFTLTKRPAHHKAGMLAFLGPGVAKSKRSAAMWDRLFCSY